MEALLKAFTAWVCVCLSLSGFAQPYTFIKQLGSSGNDEFNYVKLGNDGSIFASGNTDSSITLGGNYLNYSGGFVTKFDSVGNNLWIIPAGENIGGFAARPEEAYPGLAVDDSNNIYVFGEFSDTAFVGNTFICDTGLNNSFLAKLDASGNVLWLLKVCDEGYLFNAAIDPSGNVVLTGNFNGTVQIDSVTLTASGGSGFDILIVKYDSQGNLIWAKQAGGSGFYDDTGFAIDTDDSGNIYVGGHIRTNASFDSFTLLSHGIAAYDGFIAKYDPAGNVQYVKYAGNICLGIASDQNGNCYFGGIINNYQYIDTSLVTNLGGGYSFYIFRLNSFGTTDWLKMNETNDDSQLIGLAVDESGHCYASGLYNQQLTITGTDSIQINSSLCNGTEHNSFIICLDSTGNPVFAKTLQSCLSGSNGTGIDSKACRVAFAGVLRYQQAPVYFDNDSLISVGANDGYIAVFDTCIISTGLPDFDNEKTTIGIFPNPVINKFTIQNNLSEHFQFTLYNSLGDQIIDKSMEGKINTIDFNAFPKAIYFYRIIYDNRIIRTGKIIKQ